LEAAIRDRIGKPMGSIYQSDLDGLTDLDAYSRGIIDLTGLEHCTSLSYLDLSHNQISDLSPLSGLDLTWLFLRDNQIGDISAFSSGSTEMEVLDLGENQIGDILPISRHDFYVSDLVLDHNQISDIGPFVNNWDWSIPGLPPVESLDLRSNPLNSTSIVTYIPALQSRGVTVVWDAPSHMEGDVNGNGHVTISDALMIAQYKAGMITLTANQLLCADTNDDGNVSMADAMHIAQWLVDPTGSLGVLAKPLWQSPADDSMLPPVA
jgi:hypothetical protein